MTFLIRCDQCEREIRPIQTVYELKTGRGRMVKEEELGMFLHLCSWNCIVAYAAKQVRQRKD